MALEILQALSTNIKSVLFIEWLLLLAVSLWINLFSVLKTWINQKELDALGIRSCSLSFLLRLLPPFPSHQEPSRSFLEIECPFDWRMSGNRPRNGPASKQKIPLFLFDFRPTWLGVQLFGFWFEGRWSHECQVLQSGFGPRKWVGVSIGPYWNGKCGLADQQCRNRPNARNTWAIFENSQENTRSQLLCSFHTDSNDPPENGAKGPWPRPHDCLHHFVPMLWRGCWICFIETRFGRNVLESETRSQEEKEPSHYDHRLSLCDRHWDVQRFPSAEMAELGSADHKETRGSRANHQGGWKGRRNGLFAEDSQVLSFD